MTSKLQILRFRQLQPDILGSHIFYYFSCFLIFSPFWNSPHCFRILNSLLSPTDFANPSCCRWQKSNLNKLETKKKENSAWNLLYRCEGYFTYSEGKNVGKPQEHCSNHLWPDGTHATLTWWFPHCWWWVGQRGGWGGSSQKRYALSRHTRKMFTEVNSDFEINYNVYATYLQNDSMKLIIVIVFYFYKIVHRISL